MALVKPFRGLRPNPELVDAVAAPPYDVLNSAEARELAAGNPHSFLHVNKPEIDLDPDVNVYDEQVYQKGADNLRKMIADGTVRQDDSECFYVYKQIMGAHSQVGLVANASVAEYENGKIKKHEFTRPEKEDDRVKHIDYQNAQVGPVFLTYRASEAIDALTNSVMENAPVYDLESDGVRHTLWVVDDAAVIAELENEFAKIDALYVADGHHRSAAAMRIKQMREKANAGHTGEEPYNYFLTVIFPDNQMQILDYNRVVKDFNGHSKEAFLAAVSEKFEISAAADLNAAKPTQTHQFGMYLDGSWHQLTAKPAGYDDNDPVKRLDVSILQENLLSPLLGIENPRKDKRIDFVGGIRGLAELEKRVNSGEWAVAFAMYPTSITELIDIADAGEVMPPKSTWFEPKLKTGLVVHLLDD